MRFFVFILVLALKYECTLAASVQISHLKQCSDSSIGIDSRIINKLNSRYQKTEKQINSQTSRWLSNLRKEENKLKRKLARTDSLKAEQIFGNVKERYLKLQDEFQKNGGKVRQYIPSLDSLNTTAKFLQQHQLTSNKELSQLTNAVGSVQQKMQNVTIIKKQLQQRKEQLKQQLKNTPLANQLKGVNKQVYYYKQQIDEYKELFENTDKLTDKAISYVREIPAFKDFFNKNSSLASMFALPQNTENNSAININGLQTRASVMQNIQQRMGITPNLPSDINPQSILKDKIVAAKGEINKLKNKLDKIEGDKIADDDMPNFKPNSQKTKTFFKRLEFGFNIQSQKNTILLPTTSDIALTVGYKLNDKATTGFGIAYKLGWGSGWENISLTNQGIGIRSFLDIKLFPNKKGALGFFTRNLWITGGYELNYLPDFKEKQATNGYNNLHISKYGLGWQEAILFGVSKKQKIGKKTASFQLLYNMFYKTVGQQTQPLLFRVGYSLK